jgi:hypothetical protein
MADALGATNQGPVQMVETESTTKYKQLRNQINNSLMILVWVILPLV